MIDTGHLFFQFRRFLGAGIVATAVQYTLLIGFVHFLQIDAVTASFIGFCSGAVVNYHINYHYTFRSKEPHRSAIPRFVLVAAVGATLNTAAMSIQINTFHIHYLLAQATATALVIIWNFTGNKLWTFDRRRQ